MGHIPGRKVSWLIALPQLQMGTAIFYRKYKVSGRANDGKVLAKHACVGYSFKHLTSVKQTMERLRLIILEPDLHCARGKSLESWTIYLDLVLRK